MTDAPVDNPQPATTPDSGPDNPGKPDIGPTDSGGSGAGSPDTGPPADKAAGSSGGAAKDQDPSKYLSLYDYGGLDRPPISLDDFWRQLPDPPGSSPKPKKGKGGGGSNDRPPMGGGGSASPLHSSNPKQGGGGRSGGSDTGKASGGGSGSSSSGGAGSDTGSGGTSGDKGGHADTGGGGQPDQSNTGSTGDQMAKDRGRDATPSPEQSGGDTSPDVGQQSFANTSATELGNGFASAYLAGPRQGDSPRTGAGQPADTKQTATAKLAFSIPANSDMPASNQTKAPPDGWHDKQGIWLPPGIGDKPTKEQPARPESKPTGQDQPGEPVPRKGMSNWESIKLASQVLLGPATTRFIGGMIDKAAGVVQDVATSVKDIYGPEGMLEKAAEKMADRAAGIRRPDEYYCSQEDSDRYLRAIVTIGATTMPEIPIPELKIPSGGLAPEYRMATAGSAPSSLAGHGPQSPNALFAKAKHTGGVGPDGVYQTTKNLAKGNAGERQAAHALAADGHTVLSYKPDIKGTNQHGIDIVTIKDGNLYLIDNKAFQSAGNVRDVSALTTNLKKNVSDLRAEFTKIAADTTRPAAEREMYAEAAAALKDGEYVKAVTTASMRAAEGHFRTGVTKKLSDQGIQFINVYPGKPGAP